MKVSVICATYNRAVLLDNALMTYQKQTLPTEDWEYLICDDMSDDATKYVVEQWKKKGLPLRYYTAEELGYPKSPGQWRDGCTLRNAVSTYAFGRVLVATHPEIMIPPNALQVMYDTVMKSQERAWVTAIPYWLPNQPLASWKRDIFNLTKTEGFYDPSWPDPINTPGAPDYRNQNQEVRNTWESEVFWAMRMSTWRWFGGFRNFEVWGSVDMDFVGRRRACNIKTIIAKGSPVPSENLMVFHQWHESKRDMEAALQALKGANYPNEAKARQAGALFAIYYHGHRERANGGKLDGILGDHISRYKWAAFYCSDKNVLDIPCGTGYGGQVLRQNVNGPFSYTGVDIDQESIDFATESYPENHYVSGDMEKKLEVVEPGTVDIVLSFEGMEHIKDHSALVANIYNSLKPGGTFIISTPQKGAASGTPWDKYMLTADEFISLFNEELWERLDWFYMTHYGGSSTPLQGKPPLNAEIMILGGTKKKLTSTEQQALTKSGTLVKGFIPLKSEEIITESTSSEPDSSTISQPAEVVED